jgi:hypothetical protein
VGSSRRIRRSSRGLRERAAAAGALATRGSEQRNDATVRTRPRAAGPRPALP